MILEKRHIIPYIDRDVECSYLGFPIYGRRIKSILTGLSSDGVETTYKRKRNGCSGDLISFEGQNNIHDLQFKLHLHSMDKAFETIIVDGKHIIPIVELAKIAFPKFYNESPYELKNNYVDLGKGYSFHLYNNSDGVFFSCKFGYNGAKWDYDCCVCNQLELFEFMYKCRLDVFNLHSIGLALAIK